MRRFKPVLVRLIPGHSLGRSVPSRWVGFSLRTLHRLPRDSATRSRRYIYVCRFVLGNATSRSRVQTTRSCRTVCPINKVWTFDSVSANANSCLYRRSCNKEIRGIPHCTWISSIDAIRAWAMLTSVVSWKTTINSHSLELQHATPSLTEAVALNTRGILIQWPFNIFYNAASSSD